MKPTVVFTGENGNIYNLLGIASGALKKVSQRDKATEMCSRVTKSKSYDKALLIIMEYVEVD